MKCLVRILFLMLINSISYGSDFPFFKGGVSEILKQAEEKTQVKAQDKQQVESRPSRNPQPGTQQPVPDKLTQNQVAPIAQFPCLSKICLNDSIFDHINTVQWQDYSKEASKILYTEAVVDRIINLDGEKKRTKNTNNGSKLVRKSRGEIGADEDWVNKYVIGLSAADKDKLLSYIILKAFDKNLLEMLNHKKPTFCRLLWLPGLFFSNSGHPTVVAIAQNESGKFKVISLKRSFPNMDKIGRDNMYAEVVKEFSYVTRPLGTPPPWGSGTADYSNQVLSFYLYTNNEGVEFSPQNIAKQQACPKEGASLE